MLTFPASIAAIWRCCSFLLPAFIVGPERVTVSVVTRSPCAIYDCQFNSMIWSAVIVPNHQHSATNFVPLPGDPAFYVAVPQTFASRDKLIGAKFVDS